MSSIAYYENELGNLRAKLAAETRAFKRRNLMEEIAYTEGQVKRLTDHQGKRGQSDEQPT